jgi:hypothetical protein
MSFMDRSWQITDLSGVSNGVIFYSVHKKSDKMKRHKGHHLLRGHIRADKRGKNTGIVL